MMNEDFDINDINYTFDFKGYLFKLLSYWPMFVTSLAIAFGVAYWNNVRMLPIYQQKTMISIKDDQNPFFTSNTSLTFNWGGTTDKVNTAIITLKSRSHNEKVVDRLQYYLSYLRDGKYQIEDAYKEVPFSIVVDTTGYQLLDHPVTIEFRDSVTFSVSTVFEDRGYRLQNYGSKEIQSRYFGASSFNQEFKLGEKIDTPFMHITVLPNRFIQVIPGKVYYITFRNFDNVVKEFLKINVQPEGKGGSVLNLRLNGVNKSKLVDYLNTSVSVLSEDMLDRKNLFATKTIRFIDSSLAQKSQELLGVENELNTFRDKNAIFDLNVEGKEINDKLNQLDLRRESIDQEINYYNTLESYLLSRSDYSNVPAPSVAGITEASIISGVGRIVSLAEDRNKLQYSYKEGAPVFADIDRQIDAVKNVLIENINSSKGLKNSEIRTINNDIRYYEGQIKALPKEQQELLKIERRYNLSQGSYNLFLSKRNEAGLVKAANVSDVLVIDKAKDTGGGQIGPNTRLNYIMALLLGLLVPVVLVFFRFFLDNSIHTPKDIEKLTKIPFIGAVGKSRSKGNLTVLKEPKSAVSESFRSIRSSLQFLYRKQGIKGAKTVLITSSVSGEGKTFCSINIASVFALSGKKTILVGLDLRKPKIFGDFKIDNKKGVVNFLINDSELRNIIQRTGIEHMDVITSGPVPPNPSELLMNERMDVLMDELKETYDYIILDSPPIGLVTDSLELVRFADATLYVVRQNYTKKGMFSLINDKYKNKEISNISIVLNYFEEKAKYGYGYEYGYGYGYGNYSKGYHDNSKRSSLKRRFKRIVKKLKP